MKKKKKLLITPALLLVLSGVLLLLSTVGSARAALVYRSENYGMEIKVPSIGVSLLENGEVVSYRNYGKNNEWSEQSGTLLTRMLKKDEKLELGKPYSEKLSVKNSGEIDTYVRVILYKNWTKGTKDGEPADPNPADTELSPDLICLDLAGGDWIVDKSASTDERTVLYYKKILPAGETTPLFCTGLKIDPSITSKMMEVREDVPGGIKVTTTFAYDGYRFNVKAEVDAVQTHSAVQAIKSAWGIDAEVAGDGTLSVPGASQASSAGSGESGLNEQP